MIDIRSIQTALKQAGYYTGPIDGDFGGGSQAAAVKAIVALGVNARGWGEPRLIVGATQWMLLRAGYSPGNVDGYAGPDTALALERWQDKQRDVVLPAAAVAHQPSTFPRQKDMAAFYGAPGTNHVSLNLPYPMRIAWNKSQTVNRITINAKCADSAGRAFKRALDVYGLTRLQQLGLDLFGGCYANRPMRGGTSLSTHAFACAIDMDPENNQLRWNSDRARMARPEYSGFLDAFEAEGWISLGRERNFDWMHLQAARL